MVARKTVGFLGAGHVSGPSDVSVLAPGGFGTGGNGYLPSGLTFGTQGYARILTGSSSWRENSIVTGPLFVQCQGTFPASGSFDIGETVTTSGGFSATVAGVDTVRKRLIVTGASGTLAATNVLTGGTSGATAEAAADLQRARARVIRHTGGGTIIVERLLGGTFGGPPGIGYPWFVVGDPITSDDAVPVSSVVGNGDENAQWSLGGAPVSYEQHLAQVLSDPLVTGFHPSTGTKNVFWDRAARLERILPVASAAAVLAHGVQPHGGGIRIQGATSGATALVLRGSGGGLGVGDVTGTWQSGENVNVLGTVRGTVAAVTTTTGVLGSATTAGEWVPHTVRQHVGGAGAGWDVPPAGSDTSHRTGRIGVEPYVVKRATEVWESGGAAQTAFFKLDVNAESTLNAGGLGGVAYGCVICNETTAGTFTIGETLTGPGGWSAILVAYDALGAGNKRRLFVRNVANIVLSPGATINGTTSSTAAGNTLGWMPGASHYQQFLADVAAGTAKLGGDTLDWQFLFADFVEGDTNVPSASVTSAGANSDVILAGYRAFLAAMRTALGNSELVLVAFAHLLQHHAVTRPGHAFLVRDALARMSREDSRFRIVYADEYGPGAAAPGRIDTPAEVLNLPPHAYLELGRKIWSAYTGATLDAIGTDLSSATVALMVGQSQSAGRIPSSWWQQEKDPELAKMQPGQSLWPFSTENSRLKIWNAIAQAWQVYNVHSNANTFGFGALLQGYSGPEASFLKRLLDRMRGAAAASSVYLMKLAYPSSSLQAVSVGAAGTWGAIARPTVTGTFTVTASNKRITAASGTPFAGGAWAANRYVEISGSAGFLGGGGNNTIPAPVCTPTLITAVDPSGTWISVEATVVNEGPLTLTLTEGPVDVRTQAATQIANGLEKLAVSERKIARSVVAIVDQGESDIGHAEGYQAAALELIDWIRSVFGHRSPGEQPLPIVWVKLSSNTPLGSEAEVAAIRAAQDTLPSLRPRITLVDPSDLEHEYGTGWSEDGTPREQRGVHRTPRGTVRAGYRMARALDSFSEIPPDPSPTDPGQGAASDALGGGVDAAEGADGDGADGGTDDAGTDAPVTEAAAQSMVDLIDDLIAKGGDIAGYTTNGKTVQMRTLSELLRARDKYEAIAARKSGIRRVGVQF